MGNDPCAPLWELADWLTIEQAAALWCAGDRVCEVARAAAIASAVERDEIEARDSATWGDDPAQLISSGRVARVQVSRVSLSLWAESLPPETQPKGTGVSRRVRLDDSHLRALDALALSIGIDFAQHGSGKKLREKTELAGRAINKDAAEHIARRVRECREDWQNGT